MFWKRPHEESSGPSVDELRDYLSDRLRLVFDVATLGAYEENDHHVYDQADDERVARQESPVGPEGHTGGALSAALRRSNQDVARTSGGGARAKHRSVAQPHAQTSAVPCEKATSAEASCSASQAVPVPVLAHRPIERPSGRRQRAGHVTAPQQPCIWPGP